MTKADKEQQVKSLSDYVQKAKAGFLVRFQGLSADQAAQMRKELKQNSGEMKVFRNTLLKRSLESSPALKKHFSSSLTGANAFVFAFEDPCCIAKILTRYVQKTEVLQIKTGLMDGAGVSAADIKTLASLPSLDVLKAQMLGVLSSALSGFLSVLKAGPSSFLRVLTQQTKKLNGGKNE